MPYIDPERRRYVNGTARPYYDTPHTAGELNYALTQVLIQYLTDHGLSYQTCNDIVGSLDNAKHEFQRRIQDPYEDLKIKQNGDVYA